MVKAILEVVYKWPDGREEVRYRRRAGSLGARKLAYEIDQLKESYGEHCPYSYRICEQLCKKQEPSDGK